MKLSCYFAVLPALACASAQTPVAAKTSPIPFSDESLHYSINWPSGLGLGEAQMQSSHSQARWSFAFSLDASVPGFTATDSFQSLASDDFCSFEFTKLLTHGKRKASEKTTFDAASGSATRQTLGGGGKSQMQISGCVRDALTFLYYLRHELANGRLPPPETVYFGSPYQVRIEFGGRRTVRVNEQPTEADRITASLKGPASQSTIEMFFAHDAARTPLLVRVPLATGSFSMELLR